jgi:thioredoxin-related protein
MHVFARGCVVALARRLTEVAGVKKRRAFFFASATIALAIVSSAQGARDWLTDYKQAQEQAKTTNKLLLVNFTGSDWCGFCIILDRDVFSKPEFKDYASKNLVLLEIDFPRPGGARWNAQPAALKKQNEQLAAQYQIFGFPTIVVLNGEGKIVGALGYMEGGPAPFIAELEKLRKG